MHDLALASQPPPPFKDELTEAKRGPYTKSLHSKESQGLEARSQSPSLPSCTPSNPMAGTQWAPCQGWLGESQGRTRGPGTMTQLMSGVINTSAFPTAPTCPARLPCLLRSGLGQVASRPGCVQTSPGPRPQPDLAQGPPSTSGSYAEFTSSKQPALTLLPQTAP